MKSLLKLSLMVAATALTIASTGSLLAGFAILFVADAVLRSWQPLAQCMTPTLTSGEILMDVIDAFTKRIPALNRMGIQFTPNKFKLNQSYTAQIATVPSVEDVSTTYAVTGQYSRDLLTDVPITVNKHKIGRASCRERVSSPV